MTSSLVWLWKNTGEEVGFRAKVARLDSWDRGVIHVGEFTFKLDLSQPLSSSIKVGRLGIRGNSLDFHPIRAILYIFSAERSRLLVEHFPTRTTRWCPAFHDAGFLWSSRSHILVGSTALQKMVSWCKLWLQMTHEWTIPNHQCVMVQPFHATIVH